MDDADLDLDLRPDDLETADAIKNCLTCKYLAPVCPACSADCPSFRAGKQCRNFTLRYRDSVERVEASMRGEPVECEGWAAK